MSVVLKVENLRKTFVQGFARRRTEALRGISLSVEQGEIFGFLGPNGAGKTTTIKILMGLIFPSAGSAELFGLPAGDLRAKARIGYLPENPYFYDYLSVTELLDMVGRLHGVPKATRRDRARELIATVGISHAANRPLRSFSKGMLQRAGLAQALMGDPDLVVLDEPMSGLDPLGRKEVRDLIFDLKARGKTVFFCTHILSDAAALCDRVGIIVGGEIRDVGGLGELLSPKVSSVDVVVELEDEALVNDLPGTHRALPHGHMVTVESQPEANAVITAVCGAGGTVLAVTPHRQTLEELFVDQAGRKPDPRHSESP